MVSSTFVSISFASAAKFQKLVHFFANLSNCSVSEGPEPIEIRTTFAPFVPPKLALVGSSSAHVHINTHVVAVGGPHSTEVAFTRLTLRPLVRIRPTRFFRYFFTHP